MICMTTQCISYAEVMGMPEDEREWWYEKCEDYQAEQADAAARAGSGH